MIFSDRHKVVNGLPPAADVFATSGASDIVNMEAYNHVTFIIVTGATTTADGVITVEACDDTTPSHTTAIAFRYRKVVSGDTYGDLTDATSSGYAMTASTANQYHIIEVDAADIEAGAAGYEYVRVKVTEDTDDPQYACIVAILSEPRYAHANLGTVIT
jgi:hypothetical protein